MNDCKSWRGQVAVEFMLIFTIMLAAVSMLSMALLSATEAAGGKLDDAKRISKAEAAAQAVEAMQNSGAGMRFDFFDEGIAYRVENGRFHVVHEGKVIEVGGVFADDDAEPV